MDRKFSYGEFKAVWSEPDFFNPLPEFMVVGDDIVIARLTANESVFSAGVEQAKANAHLLASSKSMLKYLINEAKAYIDDPILEDRGKHVSELLPDCCKVIAEAFGEKEFQDWMLDVEIE